MIVVVMNCFVFAGHISICVASFASFIDSFFITL